METYNCGCLTKSKVMLGEGLRLIYHTMQKKTQPQTCDSCIAAAPPGAICMGS